VSVPGRSLRALLVGFGHVGRRLAELLLDRGSYPRLGGLDVVVVGVVTGRHGAIANRDGVDLAEALLAVKAGHDFSRHPERVHLDTAAAVAELEYDVLVDTSPLSITGRGEPATSWIRAALERGRHAITCNKGPIAWSYRELAELAAARGCRLLFEATVMDGAPVFSLARHGLRGNTVRRVAGILNSTSNLVLERLQEGVALEAAVAEAQRLGIAEADPEMDLDGWDAAVKLACLANVVMQGHLEPELVSRKSVRAISHERLAAAQQAGRHLKMLAEAFWDGGRVVGRVLPWEFAPQEPFAHVRGTGSMLRLETDILGTLLLAEEAPDLASTAYGVIADLWEIQASSGA
jgi:homoserine dehydrogenase